MSHFGVKVFCQFLDAEEQKSACRLGQALLLTLQPDYLFS